MKTKTANSTIHFFNFQNGSAAKSVPVFGYATLELIAKEAKRQCGLCSKGVEATFDENADLQPAITGTVWSGMRAVGRFRVIDAA